MPLYPPSSGGGGSPTGAAGGALAGTYPNPSLASPITGGQFAASSESVTVNSSASGAVTLDVSTVNVFEMTLTGAVTFTFAGAATSGVSYSFVLYLIQDATGGRAVAWPGSVSWLGGVTPSLSTAANSVAVLVFETLNAGTTWYGSLVTNAPALPLAVGSGGTGQTSQQAAMDALAGAQTSGDYLRGNGTHVQMSAIQAADVPTLNQSTTGNAATATAAAGLESATTTVAVSASAAPSSGQVLTATGAAAASWQTPSSGFANPMTTAGDIIYENATPAPARLAIGTAGQLLAVSGGVPAWANALQHVWIPPDNNLVLATLDPAQCNGSGGAGAGVITLTKFITRAACTITNICLLVQTGGNNTGGSTGTFVGLYDSSGTRLSGSADVAASLTSSGLAQMALTTPQAVAAGATVYAAFVLNLGTAQPSLYQSTNVSSTLRNVGLTAATYRYAAANGGAGGNTSLPGSVTLSSNGAGSGWWVGCS
jgi:hypothetical protein